MLAALLGWKLQFIMEIGEIKTKQHTETFTSSIPPWVEVLWLLVAYQLTPQLSLGPVKASLSTLLEKKCHLRRQVPIYMKQDFVYLLTLFFHCDKQDTTGLIFQSFLKIVILLVWKAH